jgi:V-type H+-transporting ATPase subunit E
MTDKSKDQNSLTLSEYVIMEAHEKSYEIEIKSLKQYEKEKRAILDREREMIVHDYEKKMREKNME